MEKITKEAIMSFVTAELSKMLRNICELFIKNMDDKLKENINDPKKIVICAMGSSMADFIIRNYDPIERRQVLLLLLETTENILDKKEKQNNA